MFLFMTGLIGGDTYPNSIKQVWKLRLRERNWVPEVARQGKSRLFPLGLSLDGQHVKVLTGTPRLRPGD